MFDDDTVFGALRAGARGYLLKDATLPLCFLGHHRRPTGRSHLQSVHRPGAPVKPLAPDTPRRGPDLFPELTDRERDVLILLAEAKDNAEIAQVASPDAQDGPQLRLEHYRQAARQLLERGHSARPPGGGWAGGPLIAENSWEMDPRRSRDAVSRKTTV